MFVPERRWAGKVCHQQSVFDIDEDFVKIHQVAEDGVPVRATFETAEALSTA
jgi:hypothetical protein